MSDPTDARRRLEALERERQQLEREIASIETGEPDSDRSVTGTTLNDAFFFVWVAVWLAIVWYTYYTITMSRSMPVRMWILANGALSVFFILLGMVSRTERRYLLGVVPFILTLNEGLEFLPLDSQSAVLMRLFATGILLSLMPIAAIFVVLEYLNRYQQ